MPKVTFNDPVTGKPLMTLEDKSANGIKKLIEQIENSSFKEILDKYRDTSKEAKSKTQEKTTQFSNLTVVDKIKMILNELVIGWHTSTEIKEEYERVFNEEIKQQTISTNLLRLSKQDILERRRVGKMYEYRVDKERLRESFSDEILLLSEP
ncbi:MAG: winged helix-turn-helix domain-containing protein [Promethearchaeota archaeon]